MRRSRRWIKEQRPKKLRRPRPAEAVSNRGHPLGPLCRERTRARGNDREVEAAEEEPDTNSNIGPCKTQIFNFTRQRG